MRVFGYKDVAATISRFKTYFGRLTTVERKILFLSLFLAHIVGIGLFIFISMHLAILAAKKLQNGYDCHLKSLISYHNSK